MKVKFWNKLESFVRREEQLWPDCGRPSNSFLPPHAVRGGKATQTHSFLGLGLNSSQLLALHKTSSFRHGGRQPQVHKRKPQAERGLDGLGNQQVQLQVQGSQGGSKEISGISGGAGASRRPEFRVAQRKESLERVRGSSKKSRGPKGP